MPYFCPICGGSMSEESAAEYEQLRADLADLQTPRERVVSQTGGVTTRVARRAENNLALRRHPSKR